MSKYMYEHTKMPPYLPMPRFLLNCPISNTAKMLYIRLLSKAQLSQKNRWLDGQGRVYFIYPIQQMATDMNKSETTIKDAMKELVKAQLLEKIPEGRGRPNRLYVLFPDEEHGQKSTTECLAVVSPSVLRVRAIVEQKGTRIKEYLNRFFVMKDRNRRCG